MTRHATARLFVAVDPPADVREQLATWARTALRSAGGRPVRVLDPEVLHVTLCFLGNQPVERIDAIGSQLAGVVGGAVGELTVGAPLWLPPRRPRALAVELHDDSGRLDVLHRRLLSAIDEVCEHSGSGGGHSGGGGVGTSTGQRRHRSFHPHVTVARMPSGAAPRNRTLESTPPLSFTPRELILYRSWLSQDGASYEAMAAVPMA